MTLLLGRSAFGEAPTRAIVLASCRISTGVRMARAYPQRVINAVLFDVDFTLARPGPELGPEGYRRAGERHGLSLEPERYEVARQGALASLRRHPELEHDDEVWIVFTEEIVRGMGGD